MDSESAANQTAAKNMLTSENLAALPVYPVIHNVKQDVLDTLDTALTWEQMTAADVDFAVMRPLVYKYGTLKNMAVIPACFFVRSYFLEQAEGRPAHSSINLSRADMCELLAMKFLRVFSESELELTAILTNPWNPMSGATPAIIDFVKSSLGSIELDSVDTMSTLELAIATKSKRFLASPVVQSTMEKIYNGRIVFTTFSTHSMIADNYKIKSIEFYDIRKAPFLDHYRLRVPRYRFALDFLKFAMLILTFVVCLATRDTKHMTGGEIVFLIFGFGFVFDEYAALLEYGTNIYLANLWNVFDSAWIILFFCYFGVRLHGLITHSVESSVFAFDLLACGACIIFPRLVFFAISNQVVIVALRVMISEFIVFISLAFVSFSGVLFALWTLAEGRWTARAIAWLMLQVWFGSSVLSFSQAANFEPFFGPIVMIFFAALCNTLLLTMLISILSNTYTRINANATQEYLFQFSIRTIENVKSDALFSYQPPFNLLAIAILMPLSWVLTPRSLHRVNVALIRLTSFHVLIVIGIYERYFATRPFHDNQASIDSINIDQRRKLNFSSLFNNFINSKSAKVMNTLFEADDALPEERAIFDEEEVNDYANVPLTPVLDRPKRQAPPSPTPLINNPRLDMTVSSPDLSKQMRETPAINTSVLPSFTSPLARFFSPAKPPVEAEVNGSNAPNTAKLTEIVLRMENAVKDSKIGKLQDEIQELKERQIRMENLMVSLTRSLRGVGTGAKTPESSVRG